MDAVNGLPNTTAMPGGDYPEGGVASRLKFPEDMSPSSGVRTMETDVTGRFTVTVEQEEGANEGEMITDDFFSANGRVVPKKEPVEDEPDRKEVTVEQEKGANEGEVITDDFFSVNGQVVPKKEPVEEEPDRKEALALAEDTPGCDRLEVFVNVEKDLGLALKSEGFSSEENDPLCLDGEILPHHVNQQREERSAEASTSSILDNSSLPGTSSVVWSVVGDAVDVGNGGEFDQDSGRFRCKVCEEVFSKLDGYKAHAKTYVANLHVCDACDKEFVRKACLSRHINAKHGSQQNYPCESGSMSFGSKKSLVCHSRSHKGVKPFMCHHCRKEFSRSAHMRRHIRSVHEGNRPYVCDVCSKTFSEKSHLKEHSLLHDEDKPFVCGVCAKRFKRPDYLKSHMRTHSSVRPYAFQLCPKMYVVRCHLNVHMSTHLKGKEFKCPVCPKRFFTRNLLKRHTLAHSEERPHACGKCGKSFKREDILRAHVLSHGDSKCHSCRFCQKKFSRKGNLKAHMLIHSDEKPYVCEVCSKSFRFKSFLTDHMSTHGREKRHVCNVCSKDFHYKGSLWNHMAIHSPQRTIKA